MRNRAELAIRAYAPTLDADRRLVQSLSGPRWRQLYSIWPFIPRSGPKTGWWIAVLLRLVTRLAPYFPQEWCNYVGGRFVDLLPDLASCWHLPFPFVRAAASRVRS